MEQPVRQHKQIMSPGEQPRGHEWTVDLRAAAAIMAWSRRVPALLAQEVAEMAQHFPHWLLVLGRERELQPCRHCGELIVFADGVPCCVACGRPAAGDRQSRLAWVGHLPTLLRDGAQLVGRLPALAAAGAPTVDAGGTHYLLVPIRVFYPDEWPHVEPALYYGPGVLAALGLTEGPSGQYHLYSGSQACLYAGGQWRGATVRVVLQQRMVNHLASLVKIAAGVPPREAFIGRIH